MAATPQESETATPGRESVQPERVKRGRFAQLARLLAMALFAACGAAFATAAVLLATPLGMLLLGWFTLILWCLALEFWLRPDSKVGDVLLLFTCAVVLLFSGFIGLAPVQWVLFGAFVLSVAAVLIWRKRPKTRAKQWPPLRTDVALVTLALGLIAGVGRVVVTAVDEELQHFPRLAVERSAVADEDNAYLRLRAMMDRFRIMEDHEVEEVWEGAPQAGGAGSAEWQEEAREVVQRWKGCLAGMDRILARPHFVPPGYVTYNQVANIEHEGIWLGYCRELARLMSVQSKVELVEGSPGDALLTAGKIVAFGLMISRRSNGLITHSTGAAIVAIGLEQIRDVARSENATTDLLLPQIHRLPLAPELRAGIINTSVAEFHQQRLMLEGMAKLELCATDTETDRRIFRLARALLRRVPLLKVNKSLNVLGSYTENVISGLDRYQPAPTVEDVYGPGKVQQDYSRRYRTWNPVGDVMVMMQIPVLRRMVPNHFRSVANARMTQVFLALRCYHLENGRLSEELAELAPEYFDQVPVDPFTEQLFRYEPDADPPRLVSLGPDQTLDRPDAWEDDRVVELTFAAP